MRAALGKAIFAAAAAGLAASLSAAELAHIAGSLAFPLATANGTARSQAMGGAFAGLADDASAILSNPAGLGQLQQARYGFTHNAWLQDSSQELGLAALPLGSGALGLSASFLNFGSFEGRGADGALAANFGASRLDLGGAWAQSWGEGLWWGLGGRLSWASYADQSYASAALDAGVLAELLPGLRLGAAAQNLGTAVAGAAQAFDLQLGASYSLPLGEEYRFALALGSSLEVDGVHRWMAGTEVAFMRDFNLRAGYQAPLNIARPEGLSGLTLGFGFNFESLQLDYAFVPFGELGDSHRVSLSGHFGAPKGPKSGEPAAKSEEPAQTQPGPLSTPAPTPAPTPMVQESIQAEQAPKTKSRRKPKPKSTPAPTPAAAPTAEPE